MAEVAASGLTAKEAIEAAFAHFDELVGSNETKHVLLEGVELSQSGDAWIITIGFDIGRTRSKTVSFGGSIETVPIREIRQIHVAVNTGQLVRMT